MPLRIFVKKAFYTYYVYTKKKNTKKNTNTLTCSCAHFGGQ